MKSEMKRLFLVSAIAAASISMTACGGGGGGSDKPKTDPVTGGPAGDGGGTAGGDVRIQKTGKAVPKEEASLGRTSGIWLSRYEVYREGIPLDSEDSGELREYSAQISSVQYVSDDELIVDNCDTEEPVTLTLQEFKDTLNEQDEYVDAEPSEMPCNGEMEYQYYERSDTDYRVDVVCRGELVGMSEMKQISAQPQYNQGSLSFTADSGESLTTNGGVCGYMENYLPVEGDPFGPSGLIELVAPYQDTKIELSIGTSSELQEGVYQIQSFGAAGSMTADVTLDIASDDDDVGEAPGGGDFDDGDGDGLEDIGGGFNSFGHNDDVEIIVDAPDDEGDDGDEEGDDADDDGFEPEVQGGTLNIESLDAYRASGSFDLILYDESRIQGNFSLDLQ